MKKMIKAAAAIIALTISSSAFAFMPVIGLWNIEEEMNGQPGRGLLIEVRNETLFLAYFGYRPDGSSVKYNASGPLVNNSFTGNLVEYQGGPVVGSAYQPALLKGTIGSVTLSFTSGTHGTLTLPGDTPKAIIKNTLWATETQDGLLGTWLLTSTIGTTPFIYRVALTAKLGATTNGNGAVATSTNSFICEFQVSGTFAGEVLCFNMQSSNMDGYSFKFSGDRGTGVNIYGASGSERSYESHALRISTKTGAKTGLNDGTISSVTTLSVKEPSTALPLSGLDKMTAKAVAAPTQAGTPLSDEDAARANALNSWAAEVQAIIFPVQ